MKARFYISKQFREFAKLKGLTVTKLAAELDYQKPQVSAIMAGKIEPSMRFLRRVCSHTKLGMGEVLETRFEK